MTNRDNRGRYTSESEEQAVGSAARTEQSGDTVRDIFTLVASRKPVLAYAVAGFVSVFGLVGYAFSHPGPWLPDSFIPAPAKSCSLPKSLWVTTWDSTETDPKRVVQHKQVTVSRCDEDKIYGTYSNEAPFSGNGEIIGVRRMGGTWGLTYWSSEKEGPGLGTVIVRPLAPLDSKAGVLFMGHEDGHDCTCGDNYAAAGPYTSVPATVSESHDVPPGIDAAARKVETQDEIKFFPEDVFPKDARNRPAPSPAKAKGQT
jgi:hypothetical protein